MGSTSEDPSYDVLIVGAGFSGLYALHRFRQLGLRAHIFEAGSDVGGVWHFNRYPGARVDSEWPFYQLSIPEVYRDWNFAQRFPGHQEIREYFAHIVKVLDLRKDIHFNAHVNSAEWSETTGRWTVKTASGEVASSKYLFLCSGLLQRRHYPDFPGFSQYKGETHHSAFWPEDLNLEGKRVCVVGCGATAVQIVQELTKKASHLSMLMRRPSLCLPIGNRPITVEEQDNWKLFFPTLFRESRLSTGGFPYKPPAKSVFDASEEEREAHYEQLWRAGSFGFAGGNYPDMLTDLRANRIAYDFWAKKTRARMSDPRKRDLMAPLEPPYPFMTRRCPLELDFYEMLDQPHVDIVDLNATPIQTFTETGIQFADGSHQEFDCVILATGFESYSGSVATMGVKDKLGHDLKDIWNEGGIATYLGMFVHGFPNFFMSYTPQAPTALSNGPTLLECQVDFVVSAIEKLEGEGARTIEPTKQAQDSWVKMINDVAQKTLFPLTKSWWTVSNIPGKSPQMLTYIGGIRSYEEQCLQTLPEWLGFDIVKEKSS